jgi:hypothetical protein
LRTLIRTTNKYLLNPLMLRLAGRRFWYASVAEHEALPLLPKHRRRSFERFGIERFLRLRISNPG